MDKTALYKLSYGLYIAGTIDKENKLCGSVVDAFVQAGTVPLTVALCSMRQNRTNEAIKESGVFSISVIPKTVEPFLIADFGFQSSRNVDKWSLVPHHVLNGLPVADGCCAYLTCKVTAQHELESHTIFIAEVTDAAAGEGEPIIYGDYLKSELKGKVMEAFKAYKARQADIQ